MQKVIWILSDPEVVIVETPEHIETVDGNRDVVIMDDHAVNIDAHLTKRGISTQ